MTLLRLISRLRERLPLRRLCADMLTDTLAGVSASWRRYRLAPILALILALAALVSGIGGAAPRSSSAGRPAATGARASRPLNSAAVSGSLLTTHPLIGGADFHIENMPGVDSADDGDTELEMNLMISQTLSDCQTPLDGEFCLRYNILLDDAPVQAGYGLIPASDVTVTASSITLRVDTRSVPSVIRTAGSGGLIELTWSLPAGLPRPALHATGQAAASVRGSLIEFTVPATGVTSGVLVYGGA